MDKIKYMFVMLIASAVMVTGLGVAQEDDPTTLEIPETGVSVSFTGDFAEPIRVSPGIFVVAEDSAIYEVEEFSSEYPEGLMIVVRSEMRTEDDEDSDAEATETPETENGVVPGQALDDFLEAAREAARENSDGWANEVLGFSNTSNPDGSGLTTAEIEVTNGEYIFKQYGHITDDISVIIAVGGPVEQRREINALVAEMAASLELSEPEPEALEEEEASDSDVGIISVERLDAITTTGIRACPPPQTGFCQTTSSTRPADDTLHWLVISLDSEVNVSSVRLTDEAGEVHRPDTLSEATRLVFRYPKANPSTELELEIDGVTIVIEG